MALRNLLARIASDLRARGHSAELADARERHACLAPFASLTPLVDAIATTGKRSYGDHDPLLRAMMHEYQHSRKELWFGLLLVLCRPMLEYLRARVVFGRVIDGDEADQVVVEQFIQAVLEMDLERASPGTTFKSLRHATTSRIVEVLKAEHDLEPTDPRDLVERIEADPDLLDDCWGPSPAPEATPEERAREVAAQTAFLVKHGGAALDEERLDLVTHTHVLGGRLTDYVADRFAETSPEERARIYQREKRRHARAVHVLRDALAPMRKPRPRVADESPVGEVGHG